MLPKSLKATLLIAVFIFPVAGASQTTLRLQPRIPRQGELREGAVHVYEADLADGRNWRLQVTAEGNEALVSINGGDRSADLTVRTLFGLGWTERLTWTSRRAGTTRITIRAAARGAPVGPYRLVLEPAAEQTQSDLKALVAERLQTEAARLHTRAKLESTIDPKLREEYLRQAAAALEKALPHWRELGLWRAELRSRAYRAEIFLDLAKPARTTQILEEVLPLTEAAELAVTRALLLDRLGFALLRQGNLEQARHSLEQAEEIWRTQGLRQGQVWTRSSLCFISLRQGAWSEARRCYEELLATVHLAGEHRLEAKLRNSLGGVYVNLGEPDLAIGSYNQALALSRQLQDSESEAQTRNNLGALYRALGEPAQGIEHYREALAFFRSRGDFYWQARTLNNLAYAYFTLGNLERARTFFRDALALRRRAEDRLGEAVTLRNLGRVAARQGDFAAAAQAQQEALDIARASKSRRGEAAALRLLGAVLVARQKAAAARLHLDRALEIRRSLGDRQGMAEALLSRGEAQLSQRESEAAMASFEESLKLYRAIRNPAGETEALYALARVQRQRGLLDEARSRLDAALAIVESLRIRITDPTQRASFLGARRGVYELLIDVLMDLHRAHPLAGHDRVALQVSERSRARTLLDLLEDPAASLDPSIPAQLHQRLRSAQRRLDAKARRQLRVLARGADQASAAALESQVQDALTELEAKQAEVRRASPRFAALSAPETLSVDGIQQLLDPETVLLEFALGEERSFLWMVTSQAVASFELPDREKIELQARRAYQQLNQLDLRTRRTRREAAYELARSILAPVAPQLSGRRIVVVPDGALHYIPFAALPLPSEKEHGQEVPLLERWEIVHLPSASALALQRRLLAGRKAAPKVAAVLADPVFGAPDPRLGPLNSDPEGPPLKEDGKDLMRAYRELGIPGLGRLPHTRQEALAIAAMAPPGQVLTLLGFEANRQRVLSAELESYRILHFATHGLFHPRSPELSGLVLSQVDPQGRPRDGYLRLHNLLGLDLRADLVVLSGCRTALGKEVSGEGFVGLARGFLYAGVPQVVASLWQVQDEATAQLMTRFYGALLKEGQPAALAMRQAQLSVRRERRWQDPFFWGAFLFQGDWR